jgi:hypothetical protein
MQDLGDQRMVASDIEHAEAGQKIEHLAPLGIDEASPLAADIIPVEADNLQNPHELGINVPFVQIIGFCVTFPYL